MSGALFCPTCGQQVAPGMPCWQCGTVVRRSFGQAVLNLLACFGALGFCLLCAGLGALSAHFQAKAKKQGQTAVSKRAPQPARRRVDWRSARAPRVHEGVLFRPTFRTPLGETRSGLAFMVSGLGSRPVVLTASVLFGPTHGLRTVIPPQRIAEEVHGGRLRPAFGRGAAVSFGASGIPIVEAEDYRAGPSDVQAFWAPRGLRVPALPLAWEAPGRGQAVWVLVPTRAGGLHRARSEGTIPSGQLVFTFRDAALDLSGADGAPVLNGDGKVVAVLESVRPLDHGRLTGWAIPASSFVRALNRACMAHPPK